MALVLTTALGLRSGSSTSPFYFSSSNSSVDLCGGWNAQLAGLKSELWDVAARLKLPWKPTALSHCQASPQMFGPWLLRSGTFRVVSLSRSCAAAVVFRVTVLLGGERSAQSEVPNPGSVFWCFQVSGHSVVKLRLTKCWSTFCNVLTGFLVTLASPTQTVRFSSPAEETKC